ncbi:MAG: tRNA uridine-5-carboxymethylaminomethyl(34) synthesis enzyme MnmG, partial [Gammaproteobacteria bacterium]|nr:tRNA uridine-5-carboxymethylaminomethyl(34) synthesis enzyme MnmG [Gammaproteobacteria bacterium]
EHLPAAAAERVLGAPLAREHTLMDLLRRPEVGYEELMSLPGAGPGVDDPKVAEQVTIQARYSGYIERAQEDIERARRHEDARLPEDLDYGEVRGLSVEAREKLSAQRPATLGQAARIPGVTPAAVSLLMVYLKKREKRGAGLLKSA